MTDALYCSHCRRSVKPRISGPWRSCPRCGGVICEVDTPPDIPADNGEDKATEFVTPGGCHDTDPMLAIVREWAAGRNVTVAEIQQRFKINWIRARRIIAALEGEEK